MIDRTATGKPPEERSPDSFQRTIAWAMSLLIALLLYLVVKPFLVPLTWAVILTIFVFPLHRRLRAWIGRRNLAALASLGIVTVALVLPLAWLTPLFLKQSFNMVSNLAAEDVLSRVRDVLENYFERSPIPLGDFEATLNEASRRVGTFLAQQSARFAGNVATTVFDLVVMLLAMFYLFRDGPAVVDLLKDISPLRGDHHDRMMRGAVELIQVTLSSGFVVAVAQGTLGGLVFWALGLPAPAFWGVVMAVLAFLPVIGPWMVWGPFAISMILGGSTGKGIALLLLGFFIVSGVDNVLRPVLIAGRSQLNGLLVFVSLLGGVNVFGFLGLVLGPLLVATAVGFLRGYQESILEKQAQLGKPPEVAEVVPASEELRA